jgi:hypothetical protein
LSVLSDTREITSSRYWSHDTALGDEYRAPPRLSQAVQEAPR